MNEPPSPPPADRPAASLRLQPEHQGRGEHVLHVDDDPAVTLSLQRLLQKLGYHADSFNCPKAALDHFRADPARFRLVLTDLMMPGMNGLQFAAAVTTLRPELPVMLFSAYADGCSAQEIKLSGIREVLIKPAGIIPIAEAIRRALSALPT
jgi:DNA-binding NtrC family response regulator